MEVRERDRVERSPMVIPRKNIRLAFLALIIVDCIIIAGTFVLSFGIRRYWYLFCPDILFGYLEQFDNSIAPLNEHIWLLLIIIPIWVGGLIWADVWRPTRTVGYREIIWVVFASVFVSAGFFGAASFALQLTFMSRGIILVFVFFSATALSIEKCAALAGLQMLRRRNRNLRYQLLVGTGPRAKRYIKEIEWHPQWGIRIIGLIDKDDRIIGTEVSGHKVIGGLESIPGILASTVVDTVTFVVPNSWIGEIGKTIKHCELQGVDVQVALDLFDYDIGRAQITTRGNLPMLSLESTHMGTSRMALKRGLDIVISVSALILLSPVLLLVAILIKAGSNGPILYSQLRTGLRGREFHMLKFRSMVVDAEARLEALQGKNEMSCAAFKCTNDPRVTRAGKFLRRFSLDELPQLLNVLKGDMSIVGPRPLIASEKDKYEEWHRRRTSVRPGITCLWQINGRNTIDFQEWMKLDLKYIDEWSFFSDLRIIAKTVPAVLMGRGAC